MQGWTCVPHQWIILIGYSDIVEVIRFVNLFNELFTQVVTHWTQVLLQDCVKPCKFGGSGDVGDSCKLGDSGNSEKFGDFGEFGGSCDSGASGASGDSGDLVVILVYL